MVYGPYVNVSSWQILLQKSVSVDDLSGISLRTVGVDLPTLTLSTQLPRCAMHMAPAGGGRATSDASRRRFWADSGQNQLILGASWTTQPKPTQPQDALQVCEPHLDLLALTPRLLEALGASERSSNVSGMLMDIARDLA